MPKLEMLLLEGERHVARWPLLLPVVGGGWPRGPLSLPHIGVSEWQGTVHTATPPSTDWEVGTSPLASLEEG